MAALLDLLTLAASTNDRWADEFFGFDQEQRFAAFILLLGCGTGIVITLGYFLVSTINQFHRRRHETELKKDMLDRGMTADEIAKVVEAATPDASAQQLNAIFGCKKK